MELSNVQSALASLEERFHRLSVNSRQRLQKQETTIAELRQQLAEMIAKHRTAEASQRDQNISHELEMTALCRKLEVRKEEVDNLRIRCEVLLQQSRRAQALEAEVQRLNEYIHQCEQEDQELYVQLNYALDENREQAALTKNLRIQLKLARRYQEILVTSLKKEHRLFTRLLQLQF